MIKVLIADDQELIRESLKIVLGANEDMEVTGIAENGEQVLSEIKKKKPNVILMDIRMPGIDGVECTRLVKEKYPDIYIIVLTTFDDDEYIFGALKYGARSRSTPDLLSGYPSEPALTWILSIHKDWCTDPSGSSL